MLARFNEKKQEINIFHRKPQDPGFNEMQPDFRVSYDLKTENWSVVMCSQALVCNSCFYRSRTTSICEDNPVVLSVKQGLQRSESGDQHWFFMDIDGVWTDSDDRVIECRRCRRERLGVEHSSINTRSSFSLASGDPTCENYGRKSIHLKSVVPSLTKAGELSIRFMTRGRTILPSARNMQITHRVENDQSPEVVFQFIKVSPTKFNIDFRSPLSPIQAFCIALSTHFWK
jgi:hypothetical protein